MEVKSAVKKIKQSHEVGSSERDVPWDQGAGVAGVGWYKTQDSDTFVGSRQEKLAGRLTCSYRGSYSLNSAWALFSAMLQFYPFDPVIVLMTLLSRVWWGQSDGVKMSYSLSVTCSPGFLKYHDVLYRCLFRLVSGLLHWPHQYFLKGKSDL